MRITNVTVQQKLPIVVLMVYSLLLTVWSLVAISSGRPHDSWALQTSLVQASWIAVYLVTSRLFFRTFYLFSSAYLLALCLFHIGLFWQYAFGIVSIFEWDGSFGEWIYLAEWYTTLALAAFGVGFSIRSLLLKYIAAPAKEVRTALSVKNLNKLRSIGIGLLVASACLIGLAIMQMGNLLQYSRFDLFYRNDTRFLGIFVMIFPASVLILFITAQTRRQRLQSYAFAFLAFLILLLSGSRSTALFPALIGVIVWAKLGRRIPTPLLVGGVLFVLLAIPVIGIIRGSTYDKISVDTIAKTSEHANIGSALSELGGSIGVLAHTVRLIPAEESYRYGYSYVTYLKYLVPNFGSSFNADFSRQAAKQDIDSRGKEALFELRPSDWAPYHIIPHMFLYGGGTGFSAIAEAYFNFGSPGVIVTFILFGVLLAQMDSKLLAHNYSYLLFSTLLFSHFVVTVRNDFGGFLKPSEYTIIVALIWVMGRKFLPKLKR